MAKYLTAIPDSDNGWTLYSGKKAIDEGRDLHEAVGKRTGFLVGVPVYKAPTFSISVPTVETNLLREMAYSQIEKRGLATGSLETTLFDIDIIEQSNGQTRLAVHLLDSPLPDDYLLKKAGGYAPSPLVRQRIENGAVLWRENRQLVFAIFRGGRLIHSQVLSGSSELSPETASEINLLLLSLQGDPAFEDDLPDKLAVVIHEDEMPEAAEKAFASAVQLDTAFTQPIGAHRKARPRTKLTPPAITNYRKRKKFVAWGALVTALLILGYCLFGFSMWKSSEKDRVQVDSLKKRISLIEPDVFEIQKTEDRWKQMEPAFDLRWFPIVQLSRITEALPGSGVVIREFETRERNIYVKGDARDVQLAFRLEEDLSNLPGFEHYTWSMPKPNMNSDNTASFRIEGKPKEEGVEE